MACLRLGSKSDSFRLEGNTWYAYTTRIARFDGYSLNPHCFSRCFFFFSCTWTGLVIGVVIVRTWEPELER